MRALLIAVTLSIGGIALASVPPPDPCADRLPHALNIGLPRIASSTDELKTKVITKLKGVIGEVYRTSVAITPVAANVNPCLGRETIQLNIAVGNDYQMLEWLDQGLVDAAVVPDLSLSLLRNDDVSVYEIHALPDALDVIAPEARVTPQVRQRLQGRWQNLGNPEIEYERFLEEVWAQAAEIAKARATGGAAAAKKARMLGTIPLGHTLVLASHLSSTGFASPVQTAAAWFNRRLPPENSALRDIVWNRSLRDIVWNRYSPPSGSRSIATLSMSAMTQRSRRTTPVPMTTTNCRTNQSSSSFRAKRLSGTRSNRPEAPPTATIW